MAAWVDLAALHNPTPGTTPPASWGDGIVTNLDFASAHDVGQVLTSQSTASTTFADLATVGPVVTVNTGTRAEVILHSQAGLSTAGFIIVSVAVSGASTIAASDDQCLYIADAFNNGAAQAAMALITGLTPGVNTFTMKYRVSAGTGTFARRRISVRALR